MMARQPTNDTNPTLRDRAGDAYEGARERAIEAYEASRERASAAKARAKKGIGDSPFAALGGGLAIGALLAALLPRTKAEAKLFGGVGGRITGGARDAFDAAKEAGREKLAELNITRDAGTNAMQSLIDGIGQAAKSSGQAAVDAVRKRD